MRGGVASDTVILRCALGLVFTTILAIAVSAANWRRAGPVGVDGARQNQQLPQRADELAKVGASKQSAGDRPRCSTRPTGRPEDIVNAALFLNSDEASFVNASDNGGLILGRHFSDVIAGSQAMVTLFKWFGTALPLALTFPFAASGQLPATATMSHSATSRLPCLRSTTAAVVAGESQGPA